MECFHCKKEVEMKIVEETFSNGTVHNAQYCPLCGGHNKYARRLANDNNMIRMESAFPQKAPTGLKMPEGV